MIKMRYRLFFLLMLLLIAFTATSSAKTRKINSFDDIQKIRLLGANNAPIKLIVVYSPGTNEHFVTSLIKLVIKIHKEDKLAANNPFKVHVVPSSSAHQNDFAGLRKEFSPAELKKFVEFNRDFVSNDIWMQDWGEVATVKIKDEAKPQLLVLDSNRGRGNSKLPILLTKFWNCYYLKNPSEAHSGGDYGGNIEVTPDDILIIGNTSTEKLRNFLSEKGYKDRMAVVETDWLRVGHCDEYLSVAPNPKSRTGYSLIKANPRLALRLIKKASRKELEAVTDQGYGKMLLAVKDYLVKHEKENLNYAFRNNSNLNSPSLPNSLVTAINNIDENGDMPAMSFDFVLPDFRPDLSFGSSQNKPVNEKIAEEFIKLNFALATLIDSNVELVNKTVAKARNEKGESYSVLSYPVLYHKKGAKHIAYIPGCVNQLILNRHLIVPDPLVESFRLNIARTASKVGLKANFLNDMMYHVLEGEIHCGTNVFRHPNKYFVRPR